MGLLPCPLPCHKNKESQSQSYSSNLQSESSNSSLSSQPSLPSVPSLTSSFRQQEQGPATYHQCLATLKGHSSYISSFAVAGKFLYSGSSNSEIRAWCRDPFVKTSSNNVVAIGHGAAVKSLMVFGDKLFSAHQDHKIRVWKVDNNTSGYKYNCIATLPTLNDRFISFFSANNYVVERRHKKRTWVHHFDTVSALAVSRDGSFLYSASWDRTFKIWRTSDCRCLESVKSAHDDAINAIVVSSDGFVYTGSADKKIKVWKKHAGEKKHSPVSTLEKHKSAVNALALSVDGAVLYSGASDRSILVWARNSNVNGDGGGNMALIGALRGHTKAILCLAVVSNLICSGSADNTVRIWRRSSVSEMSYSCMAVLAGHRKPIKCLTVVVDSDNSKGNSDSGASLLVYSGSLDCDIKIWQIWVPNI